MDLFEKCYGFSKAKEAQASGLYPYFLALSESEGTVAEYEGRKLIMCGSNNYLGLTTHPEVQQAAIDATIPIRHQLYRIQVFEWKPGTP